MDQQEKGSGKMIEEIANAFHNEWRKTSGYETRWKPTKVGPDDLLKVARLLLTGSKHVRLEIDIQGLEYYDLTRSWKDDNRTAAEFTLELVMADPGVEAELLAPKVHDFWLETHPWEKDGPKGVPFHELEKLDKQKDIDKVLIAQRVYSP